MLQDILLYNQRRKKSASEKMLERRKKGHTNITSRQTLHGRVDSWTHRLSYRKWTDMVEANSQTDLKANGLTE
jgi:hypothetical protein